MKGDVTDFLARLRGQIPQNWFPQPAPVLDSLLTGVSANLSAEYTLANFAFGEMRVATQTNGFLDLTGFDFFGTRFARLPNQQDGQFSAAIRKEVTRSRNTRAAIIQALYDLTGQTATIVEFFNGGDCGAISTPGGTTGYIGLNVAGCWGSVAARTAFFVNAYRPATTGIPYLPGIGSQVTAPGFALLGLSVGGGAWASLSEISGTVTDAQIYATVAATQASGAIGWTQIFNVSPGAQIPLPFNTYDWPNPLPPRRSYPAWSFSFQLELRGQDQFFGGLGQPPSPAALPSPAGAQRGSVSLATWTAAQLTNSIP